MAGIVPITAFNPTELGPRIHELVTDVKYHLTNERYFPGTVRRYAGGTALMATSNIVRAQRSSEETGLKAYAVVEDELDVPEDGQPRHVEDVWGLATQYDYPQLTLHKLHAPLPPRVIDNVVQKVPVIEPLLRRSYRNATPNISAWVPEKRIADLLAPAYAGLLAAVKKEQRARDITAAWTIEPHRAPIAVHRAIEAGGLQAHKLGFYDDKEARGWNVPPVARLYAQNTL